MSQTTALTQGLERIPDQIGYLVISEDGVLAVSTLPCSGSNSLCLDVAQPPFWPLMVTYNMYLHLLADFYLCLQCLRFFVVRQKFMMTYYRAICALLSV